MAPLLLELHGMSSPLPFDIAPIPLDHTTPDELTYGRNSENDIVLFFPNNPLYVSKRDGVIRRVPENNTFTITPLGRNITYVNMRKLEHNVPVVLKENDVISIAGQTRLPENESSRRFRYNPFMFKVVSAASRVVVPPSVTHKFTKKQVEFFKELYKCMICQDTVCLPFSMKCGHSGCGDCLASWFARQGDARTCPMCRDAINVPYGLNKSLVAEETVQTILEPLMTVEELVSRNTRKRTWANRKEFNERSIAFAARRATNAALQAAAMDMAGLTEQVPALAPVRVTIALDVEDAERNVRQRVD